MFVGIPASDRATFATVLHHAPPLPSRARSPDHPYRKDSPAPPEPGRVAPDPGRATMALDASHAAGRDSRLAGSRCNGGQTGHGPHGHGSVANLGAGRRVSGQTRPRRIGADEWEWEK